MRLLGPHRRVVLALHQVVLVVHGRQAVRGLDHDQPVHPVGDVHRDVGKRAVVDEDPGVEQLHLELALVTGEGVEADRAATGTRHRMEVHVVGHRAARIVVKEEVDGIADSAANHGARDASIERPEVHGRARHHLRHDLPRREVDLVVHRPRSLLLVQVRPVLVAREVGGPGELAGVARDLVDGHRLGRGRGWQRRGNRRSRPWHGARGPCRRGIRRGSDRRAGIRPEGPVRCRRGGTSRKHGHARSAGRDGRAAQQLAASQTAIRRDDRWLIIVSGHAGDPSWLSRVAMRATNGRCSDVSHGPADRALLGSIY